MTAEDKRSISAIRNDIVTTALEIACDPSARLTPAPSCYVQQVLILRLRNLFNEAGIDWKSVKAKVEAED